MFKGNTLFFKQYMKHPLPHEVHATLTQHIYFVKKQQKQKTKCLQTEATARLSMLTKADPKPLSHHSRTEVPSSQTEECTQIYIGLYYNI